MKTEQEIKTDIKRIKHNLRYEKYKFMRETFEGELIALRWVLDD